jgi:NAD(P)-dependent dehydrogenase (short-subunit alcohol dehydrogenase family)
MDNTGIVLDVQQLYTKTKGKFVEELLMIPDNCLKAFHIHTNHKWPKLNDEIPCARDSVQLPHSSKFSSLSDTREPSIIYLSRNIFQVSNEKNSIWFLYRYFTSVEGMKGKVCVVTGSNSGIGKETALALAAMGATVVMAVRNLERGETARVEIIKETGNEDVFVMICDVTSKESIRRFAKEFEAKYDRVDVLINNAGAVFGERQTSADGFEATLAVNYLGPFLLTHEMTPLLRKSAPSRIVNVSSGMHKRGKINLDSLQGEGKFRGMQVYADTKLMLTTFTYELARRLSGSGVTANVVEPGFVATNLGRNSGSLVNAISFKLVRFLQTTPRRGAETSVYVASAEELEGVTGKCFAKNQEVTTAEMTYDREVQNRLWDDTMTLLALVK